MFINDCLLKGMVVIITQQLFWLFLLKNQQRQESDGMIESGDVQDIGEMATMRVSCDIASQMIIRMSNVTAARIIIGELSILNPGPVITDQGL